MSQELIVNGIITVRRDTTDQWLTSQHILRAGELGYDTDTHRLAVGDGVSTFDQLPSILGESAETQQTIQELQGQMEAARESIQDLIGKAGTTQSTIQELEEALQGKADAAEVYTKVAADSRMDEKIAAILTPETVGPFRFRGTKASIDELEAVQEPAMGDVYQVLTSDKGLYIWDGDSWAEAGSAGDVDVSGKVDRKAEGEKGTASIFITSDGLGLKFVSTDQAEAAVEVLAGDDNAPMAVLRGAQTGPRLIVTQQGAYYTHDGADPGDNPDCEIAVKGDLKNVNPFEGKTVVLDGGNATPAD